MTRLWGFQEAGPSLALKDDKVVGGPKSRSFASLKDDKVWEILESSLMKATRFEYRFRFAIHALIYFLGFAGIPFALLLAPQLSDQAALEDKTTWLLAALSLSRQGWLTFSAATIALLVFALVFTGLGAWLRMWGSAYIGASVVKSSSMHGEAMLVDGPYRRTRNPLYLGTLLHTMGIAILMPPAGAVFAIVLLWIFQVRLALAEEPFLTQRFGQPYLDYKAAVPRFLPAPKPQIAATGARAHWGLAVLGELYFLGAFVVLAVFGWSFNAQPMRQGLLISLGLWIVVLAMLPRVKKDAGV
jgi:protein-S-isoprenylcysteine O-methyltransferase Ste14